MAIYYVRRAERWDIPALETLMHRGIQESNGLLPPYDPSHTWHAALQQVDMGLIAICCMKESAEAKGEKAVGGIALDVQKWQWNPAFPIARTVHYYVLKEHRAAKVGDKLVAVALLDAAKSIVMNLSLYNSAQAEEWRPMPLIVEVLHQVGPDAQVDAKASWMDKNGFTPCGSHHLWVPAEPEELKQAAAQAAA